MQGLLVFAGGNLLQNQSHRILAALSPASTAKTSQQEVYRIPEGASKATSAFVLQLDALWRRSLHVHPVRTRLWLGDRRRSI